MLVVIFRCKNMSVTPELNSSKKKGLNYINILSQIMNGISSYDPQDAIKTQIKTKQETSKWRCDEGRPVQN